MCKWQSPFCHLHCFFRCDTICGSKQGIISDMIRRKIADYMSKVANSYPVVTIMGPRQSGKTTLAQAHFPRHVYRNLEAEDVLAAA